MHDVIVVGAGPAAAAAARELAPLRTLILDVGRHADGRCLPAAPLHDLRLDQPLTAELVGTAFESLRNLANPPVNQKLKAPLMRFVTDAPPAAPGVTGDGFSAVLSYARGGLANAWGAGAFRFDARDLEGWPVTAHELAPFYDDLTHHIGINGADDDLTSYFGTTDGLHPPLPLSALATRFLRAYERRRARWNQLGVRVGRLRLAILTEPLGDRPPHTLHNQEFFQPGLDGIWHPGHTLDPLVRQGAIEVREGVLVQRFHERDDAVEVMGRDLGTGDTVAFRARHLLLAAGALNSGRLALASRDDRTTRLPLLDNPVSYLPLVDLARIGRPHEQGVYTGGELCLVYDGPVVPQRVQGTVYGLGAPLRGDLFAELPLSLRGNVTALRDLVPAMTIAQLFYPDQPTAGNDLALGADDTLQLRYRTPARGTLERHLIRQFWRAGYLSLPSLVHYPPAGSSMHYAGPLPMRDRPLGPYECDRDGRLGGTGRVFVIDGAAFPTLPARNHTFTIMANAARIARALRERRP